jgi:hypothetical protein
MPDDDHTAALRQTAIQRWRAMDARSLRDVRTALSRLEAEYDRLGVRQQGSETGIRLRIAIEEGRRCVSRREAQGD